MVDNSIYVVWMASRMTRLGDTDVRHKHRIKVITKLLLACRIRSGLSMPTSISILILQYSRFRSKRHKISCSAASLSVSLHSIVSLRVGLRFGLDRWQCLMIEWEFVAWNKAARASWYFYLSSTDTLLHNIPKP